MAHALRLVVVAAFATFTPIIATTSPIITPTVISSTVVVATIVVTITATATAAATTGVPTIRATLAVAIPVLRARFIGGLSRTLEEPQDPVTYAFRLRRFVFDLPACLSKRLTDVAECIRRRGKK